MYYCCLDIVTGKSSSSSEKTYLRQLQKKIPYRVNKRSKGFLLFPYNRNHNEGNVDAVLSILNPLKFSRHPILSK